MSEVILTPEEEFFIFLLENYSSYKKRSAGDVLRDWDEKEITQKIFDSYFIYHQEALQNAYRDIDTLMETGKHLY